MDIPLFDLNFDREEEEAVVETLQSRWISTGPKTAEFEKEFATMLGCGHAVAVANCTAALHLALKIAGVKEGDEVILPSLTFVATANAVRYVGGVPVFCDIKSIYDLTVSPDGLESLINERTRAIIVMHYAGFPCEMERIMSVTRKHGLKVVEDACHGPLSEYNGKKLGTFGDIGCFSFFSNKNMTTGEGGMFVTDNQEYCARARLLRSHGMTTLSYDRSRGHVSLYDVVDLGFNFRMDDIRASLGIVQLRKLEKDLQKRATVRELYVERLKSIYEIAVPFEDRAGFFSNYIFPIVLKNSTRERRDKMRVALQRQGVQTSIHYPAVHRFSIYRSERADVPQTEYVADNEITLPMFGGLTEREVSYIADCLKEGLRSL